MPFPTLTERVLYEINPLDSVICQVKFPTILKVESDIPSDFQDRIREKFPIYSEAPGIQVPMPAQIAKLVVRQLEGVPGRSHSFSSEDGIWQVSLTRDFVALTCRKYARWESFREQLEIPLQALSRSYRPSFFSRVGLRYRNRIQRSMLHTSDLSWAMLLSPNVAGELGVEDAAQQIKSFKKEIIFDLPDSAQARMVHGLAKAKDSDEQVYVIDSDFFSIHKTEVDDVWQRLSIFNEYARGLFRWCISDRLHNAMGPTRLH